MKDEKKNKYKSRLYGNCILACCGFVCIVVVFLALYNQGKSNEHKQEQNKLDSISFIQDSIKLEIDKDKVLKLQTMNQQLESQTDTLKSQLFLLTTELRSIKKTLDAIVKKEK